MQTNKPFEQPMIWRHAYDPSAYGRSPKCKRQRTKNMLRKRKAERTRKGLSS